MGQLAPVGLNCGLLPGVGGVLFSHSGPSAVSLVPLRLNDLNKCLVDASERVMGGTDMHTILNHLQTRMKEFVRDPIVLASLSACMRCLSFSVPVCTF